jgi:hypothetical protein
VNVRDITKDILEWKPVDDQTAAIQSAMVLLSRAYVEISSLRELLAPHGPDKRPSISLVRPVGFAEELREPVDVMSVVLDRLQPYADQAMKHLRGEQGIKDMHQWRMELSGEFMGLAELALGPDEDDGE